MVQKWVTTQGWLGSTPEGQRPQLRGLRAGGSLAVASSIPATQLSSPARLAKRVVTPHAPMTLGANHVSRRQKGGDPAASGDLRLGHAGRRASIPLPALTTLRSALGAVCRLEPRGARICLGNLRHICSDNGNASQGADNTSVRARGVLSVGILCGNSAFSQQISVISAETILWEEDNLQHVIWQLVMATNKVVLLYTIYATCAVSLIKSRAYIAKELLLTATQLP